MIGDVDFLFKIFVIISTFSALLSVFVNGIDFIKSRNTKVSLLNEQTKVIPKDSFPEPDGYDLPATMPEYMPTLKVEVLKDLKDDINHFNNFNTLNEIRQKQYLEKIWSSEYLKHLSSCLDKEECDACKEYLSYGISRYEQNHRYDREWDEEY